LATIESYPDNENVRHAIQVSMKGDLEELNSEIKAVTAGSGVLVSASDATVGYLQDKLVAGNGVTLTKKSVSGSETLTVAVPVSVVASAAALGTGSVNGEVRICADSGNRYTWDKNTLKWRLCGGNIYSTAPSNSTYSIPTGTLAVIGGVAKVWTGSIWSEVGASQLPVGAIVPMGMGAVPAGYLEADGAAVSRTTYADLFSVYGTAYGAGDGSTTFNLPDLRGYALRGWDHGAGVDPDASSRTDRGDGTTGDNVGTKQADRYKSHNHTMGSAGNHRHLIKGTGADDSGGVGALPGAYFDESAYSEYAGSHAHTINNAGGSETRMKNINVMFCIYIG